MTPLSASLILLLPEFNVFCRILRRLLSISFACIFLAWPSRAVLIDNFSTAQGPLAQVSEDVVDGIGILGGERDVTTLSAGTFEAVGGVGIATFPGTAPGFPGGTSYEAFATYDGNDDTIAGPGSFGLPDVDLTEGGAADRFLLDVFGVSGNLTLIVSVPDTEFDATIFSIFVSAPGTVELLFSSGGPSGLGGTLAAAKQVQWLFVGEQGASITFDNFRTGGAAIEPVPEASTGLLLFSSLACVLVLRARSASKWHVVSGILQPPDAG